MDNELHTIPVTFTSWELQYLQLNTLDGQTMADTIRALALDGDDQPDT